MAKEMKIGYVFKDGQVLFNAKDLVAVMEYMQDEVFPDPGLNALMKKLLQMEIEILRDERHKLGR